MLVAFGATARVAQLGGERRPRAGHQGGACAPHHAVALPRRAPSRRSLPTAKAFLDVEMNMGQMVDDVRLAVNGRVPVEFYGRTGGVIPTPDEVLAAIVSFEREGR